MAIKKMVLGAAAALAMAATSAQALVISFDTGTFPGAFIGSQTYVDQGYTVQPVATNVPFAVPNTIHLDAFVPGQSSSVMITGPGNFDVQSISVYNLTTSLIRSGPTGTGPVPYNNIGVQGYRNSTLVASSAFGAPVGTFQSIALSSDFTNLDRFIVVALYPDLNALNSNTDGNRFSCPSSPADNCGHFDLDGITLSATAGGTPSPVPLPPALALFGLPLAFLGWLRRRQA
jgi:hypothetical protein